MTNADNIRQMNAEELKQFICSCTACQLCPFCTGGWCDLERWLTEEVEQND